MDDEPSRIEAEANRVLAPAERLGNPDPAPGARGPASAPSATLQPASATQSESGYEIIRPIGRGAYGEVYLARDAAGAYRAVKVIFRECFESDRPFEREFEGIRKFVLISKSYDNQVQIFHVGQREQPRQFYYIMELADDEATGQDVRPETYVPRTLRSELKRRGRLPAKECLSIALALAQALESLHENGLIHRDIKPANIIFVNGRPKLADIGLVTDAAMTVSCVGTEGFIAPEGPGSPQADVYSLGKVLYEMATGRDRMDFPELPADFTTLPDRELLLELNAILARACERDPGKRYPSAHEMGADLFRVQRGGSVRRRRARRRALTFAALTGLGLTLAVTIGFGVYHLSRVRAPRNSESTTADLRYLGRGSRFWAASFSPNGQHLATVGGASSVGETPHGGEAIFWDLASGTGRIVVQQEMPIRAVAFSPNGKFVAIGDFLNSVRTLDAATGKTIETLPLTGMVNAVAISSDSALLISGTLDGTVTSCDLVRKQQETLLRLPGDQIIDLALSRDSTRLVATTGKGEAYVCDLVERQRAPHIIEAYAEPAGAENDPTATGPNPGHTPRQPKGAPRVEAVAFAPDGVMVVTGCGNRLRLWESATGKLVRELQGHTARVDSAAFSPDGRRLATVDLSGKLMLWDPSTGKRLRVLSAHGQAFCVTYSPNGKYLATLGRDDYKVKIWDPKTLNLLTTLQRTTLRAEPEDRP